MFPSARHRMKMKKARRLITKATRKKVSKKENVYAFAKKKARDR